MFEVVTLCVAQLALADLGGVGRDAKCQRKSNACIGSEAEKVNAFASKLLLDVKLSARLPAPSRRGS